MRSTAQTVALLSRSYADRRGSCFRWPTICSWHRTTFSSAVSERFKRNDCLIQFAVGPMTDGNEDAKILSDKSKSSSCRGSLHHKWHSPKRLLCSHDRSATEQRRACATRFSAAIVAEIFQRRRRLRRFHLTWLPAKRSWQLRS